MQFCNFFANRISIGTSIARVNYFHFLPTSPGYVCKYASRQSACVAATKFGPWTNRAVVPLHRKIARLFSSETNFIRSRLATNFRFARKILSQCLFYVSFQSATKSDEINCRPIKPATNETNTIARPQRDKQSGRAKRRSPFHADFKDSNFVFPNGEKLRQKNLKIKLYRGYLHATTARIKKTIDRMKVVIFFRIAQSAYHSRWKRCHKMR